MSAIVSGVAHKLLVDYIGDTKCFPFVKKLIVKITEFKDQHVDSKEIANANALEFAKLLKSMAPATTAVKLVCDKCDDSDNGGNSDSEDSDGDEPWKRTYANHGIGGN
ncbi:hypothetical protein GGI03_002499, partial [Coemansia sp. RSA 2337]